MGKERAYEMLMQLPSGRLSSSGDGTFPWWLLVPNLGHKSRAVIGSGITEASITCKRDNAVTLTFARSDGSREELTIGRDRYGRCVTKASSGDA